MFYFNIKLHQSIHHEPSTVYALMKVDHKLDINLQVLKLKEYYKKGLKTALDYFYSMRLMLVVLA